MDRRMKEKEMAEDKVDYPVVSTVRPKEKSTDSNKFASQIKKLRSKAKKPDEVREQPIIRSSMQDELTQDTIITQSMLQDMSAVYSHARDFTSRENKKAKGSLKKQRIDASRLPLNLGVGSMLQGMLNFTGNKNQFLVLCFTTFSRLLQCLDIMDEEYSSTKHSIVHLLYTECRTDDEEKYPLPKPTETREALEKRLRSYVMAVVQDPEFADWFEPSQELLTTLLKYELSKEIFHSLGDLKTFIYNQKN